MQAQLDQLTRSLAGSFAFVGIGVSRAGQTVYATATAPEIRADQKSLFRVASVSKIITAAVFEDAAATAGLTRPYNEDIGDILGFPIRHPKHPDAVVTCDMLLSHSAGLTDDGGYVLDPLSKDTFDPTTAFGTAKPCTAFHYSNLGYLLIAAAAERLAEKRFDLIASESVLAPNDLVAGFNWSGIREEDRANWLPTFRRHAQEFMPQIDADHPLSFDPGADYVLGVHTARCSPQGGLRMSLEGMLTLAKIGAGVPRQPLWRSTDGPGDYIGGLFQDYGDGEQILSNPPFYPRPLVGHFGSAYGFNGGVWSDTQTKTAFAYALNGVPVGDESDALSPAELRIFQTIAALE